MICLDTNAAIALLETVASPVHARLKSALRSGEAVTVSSVVLFELAYGAAKSGRPDANARRIEEFLSGEISVLAFEPADAIEAGQIRADLRRAGTPIGPYDVLIAGQARRRSAVLVTANNREFRRVAGLRLEDWME